ncbi:reverse transcriptase (RNA-dependent DNA polymerase), partial [Modicisalibacter xianhensis]
DAAGGLRGRSQEISRWTRHTSIVLLLELETTELCEVLGIKTSYLNYLLYKLNEGERYESFEIKKRGGGARRIDAPIKPLKVIQRKLGDLLKEIYSPRIGVYGYVEGRGIKENAEVHLGCNEVCRIDVKDFFPSIHIGRVIGLFKSKPFLFPEPLSVLLAQICCKDGALPQGAPTSPVISNMICWLMDKELYRYARISGCRYTRYADDIFFSTVRKRLSRRICSVEHSEFDFSIALSPAVISIIEKHGFKINVHKTYMADKSQKQVLSGVIVNEKLNVDREFVLKLRAMLHCWEMEGLEKAEKKFHSKFARNYIVPPLFMQVVRSKVEYLGYIKGYDDPVYLKYADKLSRLHPHYTYNKRKVVAHGGNLIRVYTEGPTDKIHFNAALEWFRGRGEYASLGVVFEHLPEANGGDSLMKHAKTISTEARADRKVFYSIKMCQKLIRKLIRSQERITDFLLTTFGWP